MYTGESMKIFVEYKGSRMNSPYRERRFFSITLRFDRSPTPEHIDVFERGVSSLKFASEFLAETLTLRDVEEFPHGYPTDLCMRRNTGGRAVVYVSRKTGALMAHVYHCSSGWKTSILLAIFF